MKEIYELDVYKLSDQLSDLIWQGYDVWPKKVQYTKIIDELGPKLNTFIKSTK